VNATDKKLRMARYCELVCLALAETDDVSEAVLAAEIALSMDDERSGALPKTDVIERKNVQLNLSEQNGVVPEEFYGTEPPGPGWVSAGPMKWVKTPSAGAPRIAVVGGGPAGLFTTYILNQRLPDASVTIFESSGRLGGKILTSTFGDGTPFEAGVAELYEYLDPKQKDPLRSLIEDDLGLATKNMSGGGVVLRNKVLRDRADLEREFGTETRKRVEDFHKKMAELMPLKKYAQRWQPDNDHPWAKESFRHHLEEELGDDRAAIEYIEAAAASDLATESYSCNGLNGIKNVLLDNDDYMQLYHVVGGIERVASALAARIRADIRLGARAVAVEKSSGKYIVSSNEGGHDKNEEFDFVVLAMPNHWLTQIRFDDPKLRESIRAFLAHYDLPAHYFRVSMLFSTRWWDRFQFPGEFWMMDLCNGCCVYDESKRWDRRGEGGHVLSFLLAGQDALLMCSANLQMREIVERIINALPPDWRQDARQALLEARVDAYAGSINAQPGGWPVEELRQEHQPEPESYPGVFLVCDCLFDSTLNAALISANTAVELLLEEMEAEGQPATATVESLASDKKGL